MHDVKTGKPVPWGVPRYVGPDEARDAEVGGRWGKRQNIETSKRRHSPGVTLAVVVLVAALSRRRYRLADQLEFGRSGGGLAYVDVPLGL